MTMTYNLCDVLDGESEGARVPTEWHEALDGLVSSVDNICFQKTTSQHLAMDGCALHLLRNSDLTVPGRAMRGLG